VERSSAPRHISAVTRDLQTAPQVVSVLSVLFGHSHLTHRAFIFVDLAIIDIIYATLKIMMMMMMMMMVVVMMMMMTHKSHHRGPLNSVPARINNAGVPEGSQTISCGPGTSSAVFRSTLTTDSICIRRNHLPDRAGDAQSLRGRVPSVRSFRHQHGEKTSSTSCRSGRHLLRSLQHHQILRVDNRGLGLESDLAI